MTWQRLFQSAKNNLGLKLLAILVAVLLWIYVSNFQAGPPPGIPGEGILPWR